MGSGSGDGADSNSTTDAVTQSEVQGSAGFVIAIAIVAMLLMILLVVVRICNIGLINLKINVFLIIVSCSTLLALLATTRRSRVTPYYKIISVLSMTSTVCTIMNKVLIAAKL